MVDVVDEVLQGDLFLGKGRVGGMFAQSTSVDQSMYVSIECPMTASLSIMRLIW